MTREAGTSPRLPRPAGPYSHAARVGGLIATAGQGGADADGVLAEDITEQTRQCLANVLEAVRAGGGTEADIIKVTVYLTDTAHFAAMNEVYRETFSEPYPARSTVYLTLPAGMLIEVDALAVAEKEIR